MSTEELYKLYCECGCKVTTDSRNVPQGSIFFALRGENFDGNEYALKALEAEKLKNTFLLNMSYEIRTPLTSVLGFAELFEK